MRVWGRQQWRVSHPLQSPAAVRCILPCPHRDAAAARTRCQQRRGCSAPPVTACHTFKGRRRGAAAVCICRRNSSGGISSPLGWKSSARWKAANDRAVPSCEGTDGAVFVACLCNFKEGLLQQCQKDLGPFILLAAVSGSFSSVMGHCKQQPLKYLLRIKIVNNEQELNQDPLYQHFYPNNVKMQQAHK